MEPDAAASSRTGENADPPLDGAGSSEPQAPFSPAPGGQQPQHVSPDQDASSSYPQDAKVWAEDPGELQQLHEWLVQQSGDDKDRIPSSLDGWRAESQGGKARQVEGAALVQRRVRYFGPSGTKFDTKTKVALEFGLTVVGKSKRPATPDSGMAPPPKRTTHDKQLEAQRKQAEKERKKREKDESRQAERERKQAEKDKKKKEQEDLRQAEAARRQAEKDKKKDEKDVNAWLKAVLDKVEAQARKEERQEEERENQESRAREKAHEAWEKQATPEELALHDLRQAAKRLGTDLPDGWGVREDAAGRRCFCAPAGGPAELFRTLQDALQHVVEAGEALYVLLPAPCILQLRPVLRQNAAPWQAIFRRTFLASHCQPQTRLRSNSPVTRGQMMCSSARWHGASHASSQPSLKSRSRCTLRRSGSSVAGSTLPGNHASCSWRSPHVCAGLPSIR